MREVPPQTKNFNDFARLRNIAKWKEDKNIQEFLKNPDIFNIITMQEFDKTIVEEYDARKAIFLCMCSIWVIDLQGHMNLLVNGESSVGKSFVCKKVLEIFPETHYEYRTKVTPEAFTYWHNSTYEPDWTWDGKICYLEDISNKLANSDTFKVMCSEGSTATVVIKQRAIDILIQGKPVMVVTTASAEPSAEILNRFSIIQLDETRNQTKKIIEEQAKRAATGTSDRYDRLVVNALTCLERVRVKIPFADAITDSFPTNSLRSRRDFPRFMDLIKASAALHQWQREKEDGWLVADIQDYDIAREVWEKVNQSGGVFGLTHRMKKAYQICKTFTEEKEKPFTAREIYSSNPFVSQKQWYEYLERLSSHNLIKIALEEREGSSKPVTVYSLPQITEIVTLKPSNELLNQLKQINAIKQVKQLKKNTSKTEIANFTTIASIARKNEFYTNSQLKKFLMQEIGLCELLDIQEFIKKFHHYHEPLIVDIVTELQSTGVIAEIKPGKYQLIEK